MLRPGEPGYVAPGELTIPSGVGIGEMQRTVHMLSRRKGWYDNEPRNIGEMLALIHSEVSEALEEWRDAYTDDPEWPLSRITRENKIVGFEPELADIVIRVMDLAEYVGIDLAQAIRDKHNYNRTRPYRHGGKRA